MQLAVMDVVRFLNVSEKKLLGLVRRGEIPAQKIHGQFRFNRTELLEWAIARRMNVSPEFIGGRGEISPAVRFPQLSEALDAGGIYYRLESKDKKTALTSVVGTLRLPGNVDRGLLLKMMLAREAMASTGIGDGIAVPHARNPVVLRVPRAQVVLGFLRTPVDFQALDGKPVTALFSLITPTVRIHLHLLSRLAIALQNQGFKEAVRGKAERETIVRELKNVESSLAPAAGPNSGVTEA